MDLAETDQVKLRKEKEGVEEKSRVVYEIVSEKLEAHDKN